MLNGPNGPVGNFSLVEVAELQFGYVLQLVELLRSRRRCRTVCCDPGRRWRRHEAARVRGREAHRLGHGLPDAWYLDDRGIPAAWPWPCKRFRDEMAAPDLSAYELA
ncbi:MAG: hypothetical protein KatS3mg010_2004 [Acidimicrobiia bacterium]|nr:MAG: hypothetical protein KatS3mg010_2004 [Acidimicrobiia bacterium]